MTITAPITFRVCVCVCLYVCVCVYVCLCTCIGGQFVCCSVLLVVSGFINVGVALCGRCMPCHDTCILCVACGPTPHTVFSIAKCYLRERVVVVFKTIFFPAAILGITEAHGLQSTLFSYVLL